MAEREDVRLVADLAHERVVGRHAPVVLHAQDFAGEIVGALRAVHADLRTGAGSADAHVEHPVGPERDARRLHVDVVGDEDVADLGERLAVPRAAQDRVAGDRRVAALDALRRAHRLVVRDVDPLVLRESRVKRDVHQAGHRAERHHGRRAGDRRRVELAVAHDPKAALALGNQDGAVREKRDAPRMGQALGHDDGTKAALLVAVEQERAVAERRAVPGLDARARRNRAALIANRRIRVLALGLREGDGAREQERARDERKMFTHGTSHRQA